MRQHYWYYILFIIVFEDFKFFKLYEEDIPSVKFERKSSSCHILSRKFNEKYLLEFICYQLSKLTS